MTRLWASPEPTDAVDRLMWLALTDNADDEGVCWPSIPTRAWKHAARKRRERGRGVRFAVDVLERVPEVWSRAAVEACWRARSGRRA